MEIATVTGRVSFAHQPSIHANERNVVRGMGDSQFRRSS
jgi:hypothetical protein